MTEKTDIAALREKHALVLKDLTERLTECNRLNYCWDELSAFAAFSSTFIDQLEAERQQREAAEKERDDLLNQEFQQRLANAEHQLEMKDLAIRNVKASRMAEFKKRKTAETELAELRGAQEPVAWRNETNKAITIYKSVVDNWERNGWNVTPLFTRQPKPVVVHPDTVRMDWLCAHVVEVRQPMFYGSHAMFFGQCDSADDEEYHSKLREQIDAAIKADGIVVKDGE